MPGESRRGGDGAVRDGEQGRFVDLDQDGGLRESLREICAQFPDALVEGLRQLAPRAVVGQEPVAGRPLDRRGERPRATDADLEGLVEALQQFLGVVEVAAPLGLGPTVFRRRVGGEPPPRRLHVEAEAGDQAERTTRHLRGEAPGRQLRKRKEFGERLGHGRQGAAEVVARQGACRGDAHQAASAITALPTTRSPS